MTGKTREHLSGELHNSMGRRVCTFTHNSLTTITERLLCSLCSLSPACTRLKRRARFCVSLTRGRRLTHWIRSLVRDRACFSVFARTVCTRYDFRMVIATTIADCTVQVYSLVEVQSWHCSPFHFFNPINLWWWYYFNYTYSDLLLTGLAFAQPQYSEGHITVIPGYTSRFLFQRSLRVNTFTSKIVLLFSVHIRGLIVLDSGVTN